MNLKQSFSLALKSIMGSKLRSFLTMLGIIIGVASVIILTSIVNGLTSQVVSIFDEMGTNLITVNVQGRGSNRTVDPEDMQKIVDENSELLCYVSPNVTLSGTVKADSESLTGKTITGVSEDFDIIRSLNVESGRFISYMDVENKSHVCVIGTYIQKELFDGQDALGENISVNGKRFTVIGVLEEKADSEERSGDDCIYIPYSLALKMSFMGRVTNYYFASVDAAVSEEAVSAIKTALYKVFQNESSYSVTAMAEMMESMNEITGMLSTALAGIAGISLLVGGIGIMNIMLVSVMERTREIGIRKSLGATPWDIMSQFVVEAVTTGALGGLLGILFGVAVSLVVRLFNISSVIDPFWLMISFSFSVIIGVIFGYFPAKKAANLNPIEALRYD